MAGPILSREFLHGLFNYDPATGLFFWKEGGKSRKKDLSVGCICKHSGYAITNIKRRTYYLHRIAWIFVHGHIPDGLVIDHINGKRSDNRIENLRAVTHKQNSQNLPRHRGEARQSRLSKFLASQL